MRILLLGAHGQVGRELSKTLAPLGELILATRDGGGATIAADLGDAVSLSVALDAANADVIVNAAAYTAVDRAEDEPDRARRINADALAEIGHWARAKRARVVHFSTDYVFDGKSERPYREDDATSPLGVYGRTKLAGEHALRDSGCDHFIFRTAWVYASHGKNFLLTMLKLGAERDELRIVDDQRGTPTSAKLIAEVTASVLAHDAKPTDGIYHLCAGGECTWFEFARSIFERAHVAKLIDRVPRIVAITTADFPTTAERPRYSVLDTAKLRGAFGVDLPAWQHGLDAVIGELASGATR
ncbi:MAG: dTDP-4-dehydrorhamnose reductase [Rudaea sp.]